MISHPNNSVIISTYNQPQWLELVLDGYNIQSTKDFEIIIADDGSDERTKDVIDNFKLRTNIKIVHVWQVDNGFQKTKILNKAIEASNTQYLIFTDGDCIPRKDFVAQHSLLKRKNSALSGGYFKLTENISKEITRELIIAQKCFKKDWLIANGQPRSFKLNKLTKSEFTANFLNTITPTKATFDGMNVSCYKADIIAVNGFDERMHYGGEDREVGERMMNNGIKFLQIRYSAICLHLYHNRPYKNIEATLLNKEIRQKTRQNKSKWTAFGIKK